MAQLHFYVPDALEKELRRKAKAVNLPLSRFLAELVKREASIEERWPKGYMESFMGKWEGELERPPQELPEERLPLDE